MRKNQERCDQCGQFAEECQLVVSGLDESKSICHKCDAENARKLPSMKFITVIIWNAIEKDIAQHDSLQAAERYLDQFSLLDGYKYGKDYFIAVMVEQQYVIPDLQSVVKQ